MPNSALEVPDLLPLFHQIAFLIFALIVGGIGVYGFYRLYLRIMRGAPASEAPASTRVVLAAP